MKKIFCFLLALCCLFSSFGCSKEAARPENSVAVYYKKATLSYGTADSVIATGYLDAAGKEKDYPYLLDQYLQAPPGDGFAVTFPAGVTLVSFKLEGLTAKIVLSDQIADFSGMDLTISLTCLTQTVMSLTGCQEVIIRAQSKQLNGQNYITLSKDSYLLLDDCIGEDEQQ